VSYTSIRRSPIPAAQVPLFNGREHEENDMTTPIPMLSPHTSYPFRLRDPVSGRFVRARFIAKLKDIADCCAAWEILAPARPEAKPQ
jgi:hypothetical protein